MQKTSHALLGALVACGMFIAVPASAHLGDCAQPASSGATPTAADALMILRAAVGHATGCDVSPCICDPNRSDTINTADSLIALRNAVGQPVALECPCDVPFDPGCTSATFNIVDSDLDMGWSGLAHFGKFWHGMAFSTRIKRACSSTSAIECLHDDDCPDGESCDPTCNCSDDVTCELTGPSHQKRCRHDMKLCVTNADCQGVPCVHLFGPPLPLSSGGTPICLATVFESPLTGTFNAMSGETRYSTTLNSRVLFGIALDQPCPRCGAPEANPEIGDQFTCVGGQNPGQACTVDGVSEEFGGTSFDCPPEMPSGVTPSNLTLRLNQVTTGTTTMTAKLPCKSGGLFSANPTVPGSNPKCLDRLGMSDPVCTSNADCKRCTQDVTTTCTSNGDCTGKGSCAEAPDQPISCGFWCHCGFCDNNASLPCFETADCPNGQTCVAGMGALNTANMGQQRPNDCKSDGYVCGGGGIDEQCATTLKSTCSEQPYRTCDVDLDCENFNAGFCNFEPRPCFEPRITRTGVASPLGTYCAFENKTCTTNADCTGEGDYCAPDSAHPETVALFCVPATNSPPVNIAGGITGPGAVTLNNFVQICHCGDGAIGCDEECDDGNGASGDGCSDLCEDEASP